MNPVARAAVRPKKPVDAASLMAQVEKTSRDPGPPAIMVRGAACHNLRQVDADIPRGAMTVCAAFSAFEEDLKGTLTPEKYADVTLLSQEIRTVPEDRIRETRVLGTIVGGRVAWEAP